MSFTEKIDVLELLIEILKEHDNALDSLIEKMELIDQTISKDPKLSNSVKHYDPKNIENLSAQSILVVDDDENLANSFQLILQSVGYKVDTAYLGQQALEMFYERGYDLVLLDLNLPDILGNDLAMEIEACQEETRIVYITGYSSLKNANDEKDTLMKPINPEQLVKIAKQKLKYEHAQ